jgi:hypothetical protein
MEDFMLTEFFFGPGGGQPMIQPEQSVLPAVACC